MIAAEFVASYFDAWNHGDAGAVAGHLSERGIYCDVPYQEQLNGRELFEYLQRFFAGDSLRYQLMGEVLSGANTIAFQYRAYRSTDAGKTLWTGAEFVTLEGDTALKIEDYYRGPESQETLSQPEQREGEGRVQRYAKSGLNEQQLRSFMGRLAALMRREHSYLDPELTLPRLARQMGCSVNHLSQVINAGFGMSFYDYINRCRVDEAARLLGSTQGATQSILDIALSVGFNSSSTFYSAFKKVTGRTPAQYRQSSRSG